MIPSMKNIQNSLVYQNITLEMIKYLFLWPLFCQEYLRDRSIFCHPQNNMNSISILQIDRNTKVWIEK